MDGSALFRNLASDRDQTGHLGLLVGSVHLQSTLCHLQSIEVVSSTIDVRIKFTENGRGGCSKSLTLFGSIGRQICPPPIKMGIIGGRFKN